MKVLFVDLGESFDDWDFSAGEFLQAFMNQRTPSVSELTMRTRRLVAELIRIPTGRCYGPLSRAQDPVAPRGGSEDT
jgi:hypothetical protein